MQFCKISIDTNSKIDRDSPDLQDKILGIKLAANIMSMSIRSLFYLSVLLSFSGLCRAQVDSTKAVMSPPSIKDEDAEKNERVVFM